MPELDTDTRLPAALHADALGDLALTDRDVAHLRNAVENMGERLTAARDRAASIVATKEPNLRTDAIRKVVGNCANAHSEYEDATTKFLDGLDQDWTRTLEQALWGQVSPFPSSVVAEIRSFLRGLNDAPARQKFVDDAIKRGDAATLRAVFDHSVPPYLLGLEPEGYEELRNRALASVDPTKGNRREALRLARLRFNAASAAFTQELLKLSPR